MQERKKVEERHNKYHPFICSNWERLMYSANTNNYCDNSQINTSFDINTFKLMMKCLQSHSCTM